MAAVLRTARGGSKHVRCNWETEMENNREEWIARRAFELWEQEGQPEGQEHAHWAQASAEWDSRPDTGKSERSSWDEDE